jgi:hypothetical protein
MEVGEEMKTVVRVLLWAIGAVGALIVLAVVVLNIYLSRRPPGTTVKPAGIVSFPVPFKIARPFIDYLAVSGGRLYAGYASQGMVGVVDEATNQPITMIDVMTRVHGVAIVPDRGLGFASSTRGGEHLRIPEAIANLWLGIEFGMRFAEDIGAITQFQGECLRSKAWDAVIVAGRGQQTLVEEEHPSRRFLSILFTLLTQRRAYLMPKGRTSSSRERGTFLGWYDETYIYLLPDASFLEVAKFCREMGEPFAVRQSRLRQDLDRDRFIEIHDGKATRTVRIGPEFKKVLYLWRERIVMFLEEDFPGLECDESV